MHPLPRGQVGGCRPHSRRNRHRRDRSCRHTQRQSTLSQPMQRRHPLAPTLLPRHGSSLHVPHPVQRACRAPSAAAPPLAALRSDAQTHKYRGTNVHTQREREKRAENRASHQPTTRTWCLAFWYLNASRRSVSDERYYGIRARTFRCRPVSAEVDRPHCRPFLQPCTTRWWDRRHGDCIGARKQRLQLLRRASTITVPYCAC
eukprot:SAG11_NODE_10152_length_851_cov_1.163564_1_plen_202_part_10